MTDYTALSQKWATLSGSKADKLAALNALNVAGQNQDIPIGNVIGYLALAGKIVKLKTYASGTSSNAEALQAAQTFFILINSPSITVLQTSIDSTYQAISNFLEAIVSDTQSGVTADDQAAILSMASASIPWWQANGYAAPINNNDLIAAGDLS